ncbi:MAG: ubiquinol-cytochrome c reductase iron-sulfur subunit [Anaerolineae bacterium]
MTTPNQAGNSDSVFRDRRWFLFAGFTFLSTLAGVFTPILSYLVPANTGGGSGGGRVLVGTTDDIPPGQARVVPLGNKPVIVTNTEQGVKAFSAVCTHLGCISVWDETRNVILCPCHDGQFSPITGAVVSGPPPTGLEAIPVSVDGKEIYIGEV